jgi:eukaryotic-like serine/threonine-protein kinase
VTYSDGRRSKTPSLPTPRRIGRYEVLQRIATGGMAEVFVAREQQARGVERMVVIKRVLPHLAVHDDFIEMFAAEARFVMRIQHPNVVQVYELGEPDEGEEGAPYLAMEYIAGVSLRDLIGSLEDHEKIPLGAGIALLVQACAGAHAAHELRALDGSRLGLVHRDISPHNLMVTTDGHVKLLDFGIAKATQSLHTDNTRTGALKGKLQYMAPEQIHQHDLDCRADVFALATVGFELFSKERLFRRDSDLQTMQAILSHERTHLSSLRPDVPAALNDVLQAAMHPDRNARTPTADALRLQLLAVARDASVLADNDAARAFVLPIIGRRVESRTEAYAQAALTSSRSRSNAGSNSNSHPKASSERNQSVKPLPRSLLSDEQRADADVATAADIPRRLTPVPMAAVSAKSEDREDHTVAQVPPAPATARWMAAAAALLAFAVVVGAWWWWRQPSVHGAPLRIVFAPTVEPEKLRADLQSLERVLQTRTGRPIEVVVAASYDGVLQRMQAGQADFAMLTPYLFVLAKQAMPTIVPLATKMVDGSAGSDGVILVREDSTAQQVADLKGKVFCHPDQKSTTGTVLARAALRKAGLDPSKDVTVHMSGNHTQVINDLMNGVCDAGGTFSGGYLAADRAGISVSRIRTLAITGRSPQDVVVSAPQTSSADAELLRAALLAINPIKDVGSETIGTLERISGFVAPRLADYEALMPVYAAEGTIQP